MFLSSRSVLHMLDKAMHFFTASFLHTQSTTEIRKSIPQMWSIFYSVRPDFLVFEQGYAYTSEHMKKWSSIFGYVLKKPRWRRRVQLVWSTDIISPYFWHMKEFVLTNIAEKVITSLYNLQYLQLTAPCNQKIYVQHF